MGLRINMLANKRRRKDIRRKPSQCDATEVKECQRVLTMSNATEISNQINFEGKPLE